jgi:pimeloyl-ACP methyl ester carboxylesterase
VKLPKSKLRRAVFLPGLGDSAISWLGVFLKLSPRLRRQYDELVLVDFPGYAGFLARDSVFPSMDAFVSAVGDLLDELKPSLLIGHSMGGWLSGFYCWEWNDVDGPRRKTKSVQLRNYGGPQTLLIICAAGVEYSSEEMARFKNVFDDAIKKGFSVLRPHLFALEPGWFQYLAHEFDGFIDRPDVVNLIHSIKKEKYSMEPRIQHLKLPVRAIWGEKDSLTPALYGEVWAREKKTGYQSWVVPGVGHSPQLENMNELVRVMKEALNAK